VSLEQRPFDPADQPASQPPYGLGDPQPRDPNRGSGGGKGIGGILAAIGVLIAKFFGAIKLFLLPILKSPILWKTGGTMLLMFSLYAGRYGWKWALGIVLLLLVHECGHVIAGRQLGLAVSAPMFIPFVGAAVALKEAPRDAWSQAYVSIGGPLLGSFGALVSHSLGETTHEPVFFAIAATGYWLNLLNLIPIVPLDGGKIVTALSPWLWIVGLLLMGYLGLRSLHSAQPNLLIFIILIVSIGQVITLFREKTDEERRYFEVPAHRRVAMGAMYFGLIAALAFAMKVAQSRAQHSDPRDDRAAQLEK
jgi:Zn-dependent protease